ncbi:hypothetical protein [Streptomyces sp. NPDC002785]|uniref:hypothetical protein n=1 Tax=Streptomyces sp. NPDC002785 TaxID=3154543 RepID=UPI00331D5691
MTLSWAPIPTGFANQQLARNLARTTVESRENTVKAGGCHPCPARQAPAAFLRRHTAELATHRGCQEDYVAARLANITAAALRARAVGGGVLVW